MSAVRDAAVPDLPSSDPHIRFPGEVFMSNILFADAPVAAPVDDVRIAPAPLGARSSVTVPRPSAYLRAIDPSLGAPTAGPSASLRAIDPSLGAVPAGPSAYLRAIAGSCARSFTA